MAYVLLSIGSNGIKGTHFSAQSLTILFQNIYGRILTFRVGCRKNIFDNKLFVKFTDLLAMNNTACSLGVSKCPCGVSELLFIFFILNIEIMHKWFILLPLKYLFWLYARHFVYQRHVCFSNSLTAFQLSSSRSSFCHAV